jgi:hypothetical protein
MNSSKFSNILLDKSPKKINKITEDVIDTLFSINEVVRELNSIDFCNPLGYILTKAIPPEGLISEKLKQYGNRITKFVNKIEVINNKNNNNELVNDIEEIRLSLEEIIPDEELKRIIPGGDGILKVIQNLNDSLVLTNTILSPIQRKQLLNSFKNRLIPLMNPINLTELLLGNQIDDLSKKLGEFIKPERFRKDLEKLIKLVIRIDKSIAQIQSIILLINKIIKAINTIIKIISLSIKIIKKLPMPAKYMTSGSIITSSSKVTNFEIQISDLKKILNSISIFLSTSVIKQIKRIRNEIFILLVGLNQLLENLKSCSFFKNDNIINNITDGINSLNNNIIILNNLFPTLNVDDINNKTYKGYNIEIINENTIDNNTTLFRRRIIVTNSNNIIEYEGTPTFSNKDYILIKEGQFFIDSKEEINTTNENNNITNEETELILKQIGMDSNTLELANKKELDSQQFLLNQINNSQEDKKQYETLIGNNINPNPEKINQIKQIVSSLKKSTPPLLIQPRLNQLQNSLLNKGFTLEEIQEGIKN